MKNELERQKERLEKELASQQEKRAFEKEMMKKDLTKEKEDLGSKVPVDSVCSLPCSRNVSGDVTDDAVGYNF